MDEETDIQRKQRERTTREDLRKDVMPCMINGEIYDSMNVACKAIKRSPKTLKKWIADTKRANCRYLR